MKKRRMSEGAGEEEEEDRRFWRRKRGKLMMGSKEVEDLDSVVFDEYEDLETLEKRFPKTQQRSRRLAAVNLNRWIARAASLYEFLNQFLRSGLVGEVLSVAVYQSGLVRKRKWPAYGGNTTRYYYAVFEFDTISTAEVLYKFLNGCSCGPVKFDLRFIPDSVDFKRPPHDIATKPAASEPESLTLPGSEGSDVEDDDVIENGIEKNNRKQGISTTLKQSANGFNGNVDGDNRNVEVTFLTDGKNINTCAQGVALDSTEPQIKSSAAYPRKLGLQKQK